jgi:cell division protein FtsB
LRLLIVILIVLFVALQYRLWIGEGSVAEVKTLRQQIAEQKAELQKMRQANIALRAEVEDLKQGLEVIEERARSELGMIRNGEVYFQIVEPENGTSND